MANDLVNWVVLLGIPLLIAIAGAAVLILLVLVIFHFRTKKRTDSLELLYQKLRELCRINHDPRRSELWRSGIPYAPSLANVLRLTDLIKENVLKKEESRKEIGAAGAGEA